MRFNDWPKAEDVLKIFVLANSSSNAILFVMKLEQKWGPKTMEKNVSENDGI